MGGVLAQPPAPAQHPSFPEPRLPAGPLCSAQAPSTLAFTDRSLGAQPHGMKRPDATGSVPGAGGQHHRALQRTSGQSLSPSGPRFLICSVAGERNDLGPSHLQASAFLSNVADSGSRGASTEVLTHPLAHQGVEGVP